MFIMMATLINRISIMMALSIMVLSKLWWRCLAAQNVKNNRHLMILVRKSLNVMSVILNLILTLKFMTVKNWISCDIPLFKRVKWHAPIGHTNLDHRWFSLVEYGLKRNLYRKVLLVTYLTLSKMLMIYLLFKVLAAYILKDCAFQILLSPWIVVTRYI
jgi:hypothetical protein